MNSIQTVQNRWERPLTVFLIPGIWAFQTKLKFSPLQFNNIGLYLLQGNKSAELVLSLEKQHIPPHAKPQAVQAGRRAASEVYLPGS